MSYQVDSPVPSIPAAGLIPLRLRRLAILFAIPIILAALVTARLFQFHVFLHSSQDTSSFIDRHLTEIATRGVIVDARGDLLAGDVWTYRFVVPHLEGPQSHSIKNLWDCCWQVWGTYRGSICW